MFRRRRNGRDHRPDPIGASASPLVVGPVAVITDENFRALTVGTITVLDLWAPWCATCRSFAPVCDAAAVHYEDRVRFASCDIDACRGVADLLGLRSIPTLVVFAADGSEIGRVAGAFPGRQLDRLLERALTPST